MRGDYARGSVSLTRYTVYCWSGMGGPANAMAFFLKIISAILRNGQQQDVAITMFIRGRIVYGD